MNDYEQRWTDVQTTIGKAVVMWSRLDFFIAMAFRLALESPPALSAYLARRLSTAQRLEAMKIAARDYDEPDRLAALEWINLCSKLNTERNQILHRSYADQSDGEAWHPTALWLNGSGSSGGSRLDYIDSERFEDATYGHFIARCSEAMALHSRLPRGLNSWISPSDEPEVNPS